MMADTYAMMSEVKMGLYKYQILRIMPQYKLHKYHGWMPAFTPPFHILCIPISWLVFKKKGATGIYLTKVTKLMNYFIFLILSSAIFIALNAVMLPFAYLKTVMVKISLSYRGVIRTCEFCSYLLIGLPRLLILQVMDFVAYI